MSVEVESADMGPRSGSTRTDLYGYYRGGVIASRCMLFKCSFLPMITCPQYSEAGLGVCDASNRSFYNYVVIDLL